MGIVTPCANVPSPRPIRICTSFPFESVTARSGWPSPLKSPTATLVGFSPAGISIAGWKVPSPLPSKTDTSFEPMLAVMMSWMPLPVRSAVVTKTGSAPTDTAIGG